jgi:bacillithiol system protein YtxJ
MNWNPLIDQERLGLLQKASFARPVILVKHSPRCGISSIILDRLSRDWDEEAMAGSEPWMIDVIANRNISNAISETYSLRHESPQLLVIWEDNVIYHTSHMGINFAALKAAVQPLLV